MNREIKILNESVVFNLYALYSFLRKLTTPFNKTKAFELGIIDAAGKILKKKSELKTSEEKAAYTWFDLLVWNLKKLIERLPFGKSRLATIAAAMFLLKEEKYARYYVQDDTILSEAYLDFYESIGLDEQATKDIEKLDKELEAIEETPVNNSGDGAVAGINADDTVVKKQPDILTRAKPICKCPKEKCICPGRKSFKDFIDDE